MSGIETTEKVSAKEKLEAAEARARAAADRLSAVLQSTSDCVYVLDRDWRFTFMNQRAIGEVAGGRDLTGHIIWEEYPHAVGSTFWDNYQAVMREGRPTTFEAYYPEPLNNWYEVNAYPSIDGIAVFFRNISERRAADEQQRLLINELNHRVKNTLATVQALASQVQRSTRSPEEAGMSFMARLRALAAAHDVLTGESWVSADLAHIVAGVTDLYGGRVRARGPSVRLEPRAALTLAMALHELATNATKYGALSNHSGHVDLAWSLEAHGLKLQWHEHGGPIVVPPLRQGFGSRLIERGIAGELGGEARTDYHPSGVICVMQVPSSQLRDH